MHAQSCFTMKWFLWEVLFEIGFPPAIFVRHLPFPFPFAPLHPHLGLPRQNCAMSSFAALPMVPDLPLRLLDDDSTETTLTSLAEGRNLVIGECKAVLIRARAPLARSHALRLL